MRRLAQATAFGAAIAVIGGVGVQNADAHSTAYAFAENQESGFLITGVAAGIGTRTGTTTPSIRPGRMHCPTI